MTIDITKQFITRGGRIVRSVIARNSTDQPFEVQVMDYSYSVYPDGMFYNDTSRSPHDILELDDDGEFVSEQECVTRDGLEVVIERVCSWPLSEEDRTWYAGWAGHNDVVPSQTYCLYGQITLKDGTTNYLSWSRGGRYTLSEISYLDLMPKAVFETSGARAAIAAKIRQQLEKMHAHITWNSPKDLPPADTSVYLTVDLDAFGGKSVIPAYCKYMPDTVVLRGHNPKKDETTDVKRPLRFFSSWLDSTPIAPDIIVGWAERPHIKPATNW